MQEWAQAVWLRLLQGHEPAAASVAAPQSPAGCEAHRTAGCLARAARACSVLWTKAVTRHALCHMHYDC